MIEKILDKYYTKKLKKWLDRQLLFWLIDHRYIEKGDWLKLQVKKEEYNNEQYKEILTFNKEMIFFHLCNQDELNEILKQRINKYFEENK